MTCEASGFLPPSPIVLLTSPNIRERLRFRRARVVSSFGGATTDESHHSINCLPARRSPSAFTSDQYDYDPRIRERCGGCARPNSGVREFRKKERRKESKNLKFSVRSSPSLHISCTVDFLGSMNDEKCLLSSTAAATANRTHVFLLFRNFRGTRYCPLSRVT